MPSKLSKVKSEVWKDGWVRCQFQPTRRKGKKFVAVKDGLDIKGGPYFKIMLVDVKDVKEGK